MVAADLSTRASVALLLPFVLDEVWQVYSPDLPAPGRLGCTFDAHLPGCYDRTRRPR